MKVGVRIPAEFKLALLASHMVAPSNLVYLNQAIGTLLGAEELVAETHHFRLRLRLVVETLDEVIHPGQQFRTVPLSR